MRTSFRWCSTWGSDLESGRSPARPGLEHDGLVGDEDVVVAAARELDIQERESRWTHLSLCVLDAVFSINARYATTCATVRHYAGHCCLAEPLLPAGSAHQVISTPHEERLDRFVEEVEKVGVESFAAEVLHNRQRTSTRSGIRKAEASLRYARVLLEAGVSDLGDAAALLVDDARLTKVEAELARVPGHGAHGVRMGYLWMLVGDDHRVKPDRMVLRWLADVLAAPVPVVQARTLLERAAADIGCTPWALDHAIWTAARGR